MYIPFIFIVSMSTIAFTTNVMGASDRPAIKFTGETSGKIYSTLRKCAGSESKEAELMAIVSKGNIREDNDFKKFVYCAFYESGYANEDGRVNIEASAVLYPDPAAMLTVLKQCNEKQGSTPVDTLFEFFKCFQERSPYLIGN